MTAMNDLLTGVLGGVEYNWEKHIHRVVASNMPRLARSGRLQDVITDVTSDFVLASQDGSLKETIIKAKENSEDDVQLLDNMKKVLNRGIWYRTSTAIRSGKRKKVASFSEVDQGDTDEEIANSLMDHRIDSDKEYLAYGDELVKELEVMATAAEWKNNHRLAKRLRLAKEMVHSRLEGKTFGELQVQFSVKGTATMKAILDDMGQALARIAARTGDSTLLNGTKELVA